MSAARSAGGWLLRRPSAEATARIFCFPYSGVGASMFNRWPQRIGDVELCPIQPPGRENRFREGHYGTYDEFARTVAEPLAQYLDRPSVFFGHCAGALPAFETICRLASFDLPTPRRLVASAQVAPRDCPHDRLLDCTPEELAQELERLVILRGGQPHPALIQVALEVLVEDLEANRVYRRSEPIQIPSGITVLHWSDDDEVSRPALGGWREYAADVRFLELPGGHYDFLAAPPSLLEVLVGAALDSTRSSGSNVHRHVAEPGDEVRPEAGDRPG